MTTRDKERLSYDEPIQVSLWFRFRLCPSIRQTFTGKGYLTKTFIQTNSCKCYRLACGWHLFIRSAAEKEKELRFSWCLYSMRWFGEERAMKGRIIIKVVQKHEEKVSTVTLSKHPLLTKITLWKDIARRWKKWWATEKGKRQQKILRMKIFCGV